ncbi:bifunctional precorrin-2 dehydrogenase/sirohydrochlorin ferrochelatase [Halovenus rubra]|uniref:precorrin-2 dehydrogenase n=2 Tax=Halovenus rubra TaxID=869890 RepID=A0ABD5XC52_9EURY|nr:bifunctional precorrin-2 dehydrogenase/sirohydrochlorin ferrochelatase [Halovenus rubra]
MIPLLHDFDGETVLVFGGGPVGARKARRFADAGTVLVVSASFAGTDFGGAEQVRAAVDADYARELLARCDPALVVVATDDEALNDAIQEAADVTTLVNRADRPGARQQGSVVVPATLRSGPVTVSVATDATSPAVSRHLREQIEGIVEGAGLVAKATGALRADLRERPIAPEKRQKAVSAAADHPGVWTAARDGDLEEVRDLVRTVTEDTLGG